MRKGDHADWEIDAEDRSEREKEEIRNKGHNNIQKEARKYIGTQTKVRSNNGERKLQQKQKPNENERERKKKEKKRIKKKVYF